MKLFERANIGAMELKNRVAMAPMGTNGLTDIDCGYSRRLIDFYTARAKGGAGMIMTGAAVTNTELEGGIAHFLPRMNSPTYMGRLSELCDAVHHYDCKLVLQLTAGFGRVNFVENNPIQPISASETPCFLAPDVSTRALTVQEIAQLVQSFAAAVGMAKVAGVDAVEVQGYGGYLIDQFQSSLWNKRDDDYGGDLDGRMKFTMELLAASRYAAGPDLPIIFKFTPDHYIEGGRRIDEGLEIARRLEAAGVDALHVDGGCYEVWHRVIPSMYEAPAGQIGLARAVKEAVGIPVIANGKLGRPEIAQNVVAEGKTDFVALGRPLLADPEWPEKVRSGRLDDIRPCIGCNEACLGRGYEMKYLSCTVNPLTGMERDYALIPAVSTKRVLVVGGGPAGLEAARVAALRGYQVSLWERASSLGGKMRAAAVPEFKEDIRPLIEYMSAQAHKAGVEIRLDTEATVEAIRAAAPDVVVLATGSVLSLPDIPGLSRSKVLSTVDAMEAECVAGERVLVAGGGLCGCETAVHLSRQGKSVTLVEKMPELVPDGTNINTRMGILELVALAGIEVLTGTSIIEVTEAGAVVDCGGAEREISADAVVMASGFTRDVSLRDALEDSGVEVFVAGDCANPRNIMGAVWDGFHAGRVM